MEWGIAFLENENFMPHGKETLTLNTGFRTAASKAFESALAEIEKNWDGALSGKDSDAVHDLRVGTRRLRAALSVYEAALPEKDFHRVETSISSITDALGPARDADVLLEHLEAVAEKYESENGKDAVGIKAFMKTVRETRDHEQELLDKALKKFDLGQLKSDLRPSQSDEKPSRAKSTHG